MRAACTEFQHRARAVSVREDTYFANASASVSLVPSRVSEELVSVQISLNHIPPPSEGARGAPTANLFRSRLLLDQKDIDREMIAVTTYIVTIGISTKRISLVPAFLID